MGLYDSFISEETCPICRKKGKFEFQTKSLIRQLCYWEKGEKVETDMLIIKDCIIKDCLGTCPSCKKLVFGDIIIKNNIFIKVINLRPANFSIHKKGNRHA